MTEQPWRPSWTPSRRSGSTRSASCSMTSRRELQHQADRAPFARPGRRARRAGRPLSSTTWARSRRLVVCPTVYCGRATRNTSAPRQPAWTRAVDLFWTGRAICSPTLELLDAATFTRAANRRPTYWDNYPVNDVAMTHELHIGPYRGRDRHLYRFANGVIANGMELVSPPRSPLRRSPTTSATPRATTPKASWQRAIREVAGEADAEAFALFADNVRSSALAAGGRAARDRGAARRSASRREHGDRGARRPASSRRPRTRWPAAARSPAARARRKPALIDEARPWIEASRSAPRRCACIARLGRRGPIWRRTAPTELRPLPGPTAKRTRPGLRRRAGHDARRSSPSHVRRTGMQVIETGPERARMWRVSAALRRPAAAPAAIDHTRRPTRRGDSRGRARPRTAALRRRPAVAAAAPLATAASDATPVPATATPVASASIGTRPADRDGLARRGADPRLGRRRGAVRGRPPGRQRRD